jgi:hypothetical protein
MTLNAASPEMQLGFKSAFWLSLILLVVSTWTMRYPYRPDLVAAGLVLPGLLVRARAYKIMAVLVLCFALYGAWYGEWLMNAEAPYND